MKEINNHSQIILYTTVDGKVKIDSVFQNDTIGLTQNKMAEFFDVNIPAISKHLSLFQNVTRKPEVGMPTAR